jgi:hypothetical protein
MEGLDELQKLSSTYIKIDCGKKPAFCCLLNVYTVHLIKFNDGSQFEVRLYSIHGYLMKATFTKEYQTKFQPDMSLYMETALGRKEQKQKLTCACPSVHAVFI